MRHRKYTFKIGKTSSHRKAMVANMLSSLFEHGKIKTTLAKAKELRRRADKMITAAKIGDLHNRRKVICTISNRRFNYKYANGEIKEITAVQVLFDELNKRYLKRPGGYTRIVRIGYRRGDSSELCYLKLVEEELILKVKSKVSLKKEESSEKSDLKIKVSSKKEESSEKLDLAKKVSSKKEESSEKSDLKIKVLSKKEESSEKSESDLEK